VYAEDMYRPQLFGITESSEMLTIVEPASARPN